MYSHSAPRHPTLPIHVRACYLQYVLVTDPDLRSIVPHLPLPCVLPSYFLTTPLLTYRMVCACACGDVRPGFFSLLFFPSLRDPARCRASRSKFDTAATVWFRTREHGSSRGRCVFFLGRCEGEVDPCNLVMAALPAYRSFMVYEGRQIRFGCIFILFLSTTPNANLGDRGLGGVGRSEN